MWTNRTKIINQLINRDYRVIRSFNCPHAFDDDPCMSGCKECIEKWLDEKVNYTPKEKI